jgi:methionine--tRNA ligase beta chain
MGRVYLNDMSEKIPFDDFKKVELRIARVLTAERVEGSEKLVKLEVAAGDTDEAGLPVTRQILAGIGKEYAPETLVGKSITIVANLAPRTLMGLESNGMLLAASEVSADGTRSLSLLMPDKDIAPGSSIS